MGLFQNFTIKDGDAITVPASPSYIKNLSASSASVNILPSPTGQVLASPGASSILGGVRPYETEINNQGSTVYATTNSNGIGTGMTITTTIVDRKIATAVISGGSNYAPGNIVNITLVDATSGLINGSLDGKTATSPGITGTFVARGLTAYTPSGGSGSGFNATFVISEVDGVLTISLYSIVSAGTGYKKDDVLYFGEYSQAFYWTLSDSDVSKIDSSQVEFELKNSNFTEADLMVVDVLEAGQISTMRASKFDTNEASDTAFLTMINK